MRTAHPKFETDHFQEAQAFLNAKFPIAKLLLPWCIALCTAVILLWSWFSNIDIVSMARGVIIPNSRLQVIQSNATNVVNKILVKEGQLVKKGQLLVEYLQKDETAEKEKIYHSLQRNQAIAYRLHALMSYIQNRADYIPIPQDNAFLSQEAVILGHQRKSITSEILTIENSHKALQSSQKSLHLEVELLERLIPMTSDRIHRFNQLLEEGIVERERLDELREKKMQQQQELKIKKSELTKIEAEIDATLQNKLFTIENHKKSFQTELGDIEQSNRVLELELQKLNSSIHLKNPVSPIDGIVNTINVFTKGAVVQSGEEIMTIVPQNSLLQVEAKIMNQDVGFVKLGQEVSIKLDSFSFTKYGKLVGKVQHISSGGIEDPQMGMVYTSIIELKANEIEIDGEIFRLKPGMTVTVDIKTGKRKIIDYIIEPFLRYGDEALRER